MAKYIDSEALKSEFEEDGHLSAYIEEMIDAIPAADVRPVVRGKWISTYNGETVIKLDDGEPIDSCFCSVCRKWLVASDEYAVKGNFCPNCGADMR